MLVVFAREGVQGVDFLPKRRSRLLGLLDRVLVRVLRRQLARLGRFRILPAAAEEVADVGEPPVGVLRRLLVRSASAIGALQRTVAVVGLRRRRAENSIRSVSTRLRCWRRFFRSSRSAKSSPTLLLAR